MSGIDEASKKIKLRLADYTASTMITEPKESVKKNNIKKEKTGELERKTRLTVYFTEKEYRMLNEVYSKHLLAGNKRNKSSILGEAIKFLYSKEVSDDLIF